MGGAAVQVLQPTVCSDVHQKKIVGRRKVCVWGIAKGRARSQTAKLPARIMFKKSKSKVLVDEASEEDDVSWHQEHASKDKDSEGTEEVLSPSTKDSKLKKVKSKREKGDKKLFPSQDDEHILLTGVTVSHRRGSAKKNWEDDKSKTHSEKDKAHCLWDSITMTMKQITPTRKIDKIEGWEPPQLSDEWRRKKTSRRGREVTCPRCPPLCHCLCRILWAYRPGLAWVRRRTRLVTLV
ncbi:hypothetical protein QQF64_021266 [Cirrhinus molitorella]|uniref:Testis development-related protein n=1 Tax=Cirrhinus molitorella TaxID=172907 RepID=A0ABR3LDU3_9TELE